MMTNDFYNDEFEELLKEKADQFSMYPSKRVWHGIYNSLHPGRRWPSMAVGTLLITSLLLIGYLNTGDYRINTNAGDNSVTGSPSVVNQSEKKQNQNKKQIAVISNKHKGDYFNNAFDDVIKPEDDFQSYTVVRNNRPDNFYTAEHENIANLDLNTADNKQTSFNKKEFDIIRDVDLYIKSNQVYSDVKQIRKHNSRTTSTEKQQETEFIVVPDRSVVASLNKKDPAFKLTAQKNETDPFETAENNTAKNTESVTAIDELTSEEKAWIENFAMYNKNAPGKFKGRLSYQVYATPAVNYRKLTTESKGSVAPFALADVNDVISQKPGIGLEAGFTLNYKAANRLQVKAGIQFNYTNYNIDADRTNHPIQTTILLVDPVTGFTYPANRTSTMSNNYSGSALQPVTLHNRTYQLSLPVGFAYKLSSENNVDWFAGATIQPTYVFGGKAHLISSDLKSYVADPSSIRSWNLNLGFETYMNFKLGGSYDLQVGPQVRYQVYSTYRKNVALIEKPYAIGLKFGLTKGF